MKKTDLRITFRLLKGDWLCLFPPSCLSITSPQQGGAQTPRPSNRRRSNTNASRPPCCLLPEKTAAYLWAVPQCGKPQGYAAMWNSESLKTGNPLSSLPEGLQVNLKVSLSTPSGQTHALLSKVLVSHFIPWLT